MATEAEFPLFVSLGLVVLDEIQIPGRETLHDVVGGSCSFSTVGARLAVEDDEAERIACFVIAGEDFPAHVERQLRSWDIDLEVQKRPGIESTRGKLQYHDTGFSCKTFGYTSPPLQAMPSDLPKRHLHAQAFHFLGSPDQAIKTIKELLKLRGSEKRPLLVYEPLPMLCRPNGLQAHIEASKLVDVFSPNHLELDALCGRLESDSQGTVAELGRKHIEKCVFALFDAHPQAFRQHQLCVVRAGEYGALVARRCPDEDEDDIEMSWVDAYYSTSESERIVDATGAGNAFLGAFAVELLKTSGDAVRAAMKASVAASFAMEQVGLPVLAKKVNGPSTWNGTSVTDRMNEYVKTSHRQLN